MNICRNIRVLMVGPSVSGKSTVANAIFGENKFAVQASEDNTQKRSDWQHMTKNGRRIEVTTNDVAGGGVIFVCVCVCVCVRARALQSNVLGNCFLLRFIRFLTYPSPTL